jgi:putative flavoprotein involved in K+ transport
MDGERAQFADDLATTVASADHRMQRVLDRIDHAIERFGLTSEVLPAEPVRHVSVGEVPDTVDLAREGIASVVWATGHRRRYDWLDLPVVDIRGEIRQWRGVTDVPGAYVLGQRFQHYRNSNFIDGVGRDAAFVADHIRARSDRHSSHCPAPCAGREVDHG